MTTQRTRMGPVETATRADLRRLGVSVRESALAAGLVRLARALDADASASGIASGLRELRATLGEVASLSAPTRPVTAGAEVDPPTSDLDRIREKREARLGRTSG